MEKKKTINHLTARAMGLPARSRAIDDSIVDTVLDALPCGGIPIFDEDSGCSYRCDTCFAVIGSIGQPQRCKDLMQDAENRKIEWRALGGKWPDEES